MQSQDWLTYTVVPNLNYWSVILYTRVHPWLAISAFSSKYDEACKSKLISPNFPSLLHDHVVSNGVVRPIWWFRYCWHMSPHRNGWIEIRWTVLVGKRAIASVSSLVQTWGNSVHHTRSFRPPPPEQGLKEEYGCASLSDKKRVRKAPTMYWWDCIFVSR